MESGTIRLCKGRALVKLPVITNDSKITLTRKYESTPNSGNVCSEIILGKGFRIKSDSKRDNGNITWSIN